MSVVSNYDLVLDCSDNVATRYLLNDACVLANKPLISGSALRMEGQLTVYNFTDSDGVRGPCYRCIFPVPPPASAVTNCNDGGVLGAGVCPSPLLIFVSLFLLANLCLNLLFYDKHPPNTMLTLPSSPRNNWNITSARSNQDPRKDGHPTLWSTPPPRWNGNRLPDNQTTPAESKMRCVW